MAPLFVPVNGSSGFIGTRVVRHLHAAGHRVTGLDHIPPKNPLPEGVTFRVRDIRQGELLDRTFDAVVHLALESFRRRIEAGQPVIINGDGSHRDGHDRPPKRGMGLEYTKV